jgi:aspartate/methionine/tyrosine aminotransferase
MVSTSGEDSLIGLLNRHAELESRHGDGDAGRFISGWQCENPWEDEISEAVLRERQQIRATDYLYFDHDPAITSRILQFHETVDGISPPSVLPGAGASSIIFTFCAWLRDMNIEEIFYIPPLYFSAHFALRLLGIRARPVSGRQIYEDGFSINFPSAKSVMMLADPLWYAGISLSEDLIKALVDWQHRTGSLVFVDGSFQYSHWSRQKLEQSARFDPDHTVRVICPTKPLAAHNYRFAYGLFPKTMHEKCAHIYANVYGSTSVDNVAFARTAASMMLDGEITGSLMDLASSRHRALRARAKISAPWQPSCGYFVFEKVIAPLPEGTLLMDGSFFEQKRYPGFTRINLLSPSISMLD